MSAIENYKTMPPSQWGAPEWKVFLAVLNKALGKCTKPNELKAVEEKANEKLSILSDVDRELHAKALDAIDSRDKQISEIDAAFNEFVGDTYNDELKIPKDCKKWDDGAWGSWVRWLDRELRGAQDTQQFNTIEAKIIAEFKFLNGQPENPATKKVMRLLKATTDRILTPIVAKETIDPESGEVTHNMPPKQQVSTMLHTDWNQDGWIFWIKWIHAKLSAVTDDKSIKAFRVKVKEKEKFLKQSFPDAYKKYVKVVKSHMVRVAKPVVVEKKPESTQKTQFLAEWTTSKGPFLARYKGQNGGLFGKREFSKKEDALDFITKQQVPLSIYNEHGRPVWLANNAAS